MVKANVTWALILWNNISMGFFKRLPQINAPPKIRKKLWTPPSFKRPPSNKRSPLPLSEKGFQQKNEASDRWKLPYQHIFPNYYWIWNGGCKWGNQYYWERWRNRRNIVFTSFAVVLYKKHTITKFFHR